MEPDPILFEVHTQTNPNIVMTPKGKIGNRPCAGFDEVRERMWHKFREWLDKQP